VRNRAPLLVAVKLARRTPRVPPGAIDAFVSGIMPHVSERSHPNRWKTMAPSRWRLPRWRWRRFSEPWDQGNPLEDLVDTADWIPAIVALAVNTDDLAALLPHRCKDTHRFGFVVPRIVTPGGAT
jgi:hypothetical protein